MAIKMKAIALACLLSLCIVPSYAITESLTHSDPNMDIMHGALIGFTATSGPGAVACFELNANDGAYPAENVKGFLTEFSADGVGGHTVVSFDMIHTINDEGDFTIDASVG